MTLQQEKEKHCVYKLTAQGMGTDADPSGGAKCLHGSQI